MTGPMSYQLPQGPPGIRIGVWGPPTSGKTTFLAALHIAVNQWRGPGNWIMNGSDDDSSEFLTTSTDLLTRQAAFPSATKASQNLLFRFTGTEGEPEQQPQRRLRKPATPERISFDLDVLDVPGGRFHVTERNHQEEGDSDGGVSVSDGAAPAAHPVDLSVDSDEDLILHLENCNGIIYLFDPVRDSRTGDAYEYFHRIIEQLARRFFERQTFTGSRLPHFVAVCVTKFDDPEVYNFARRLGLTTYSEYAPGLPYVPDIYAYELFRHLCSNPHSRADMVHSSLPRYFHRDRIRVFVTSAVGFFVGPSQRFRPNDFANVYRDETGQARIRGRVYPMNVLEPVIWLQNRLRNAR